MDIITYALRDGGPDSDRFYREAAAFADEVCSYAERAVLPAVEEYRRYVRAQRGAEPRSTEEYVLELLVLGVLWRAYGRQAKLLGGGQARLLSRLAAARGRAGPLKPAVDRLRGVLGGLWLHPARGQAGPLKPAIDRLRGVLGGLWLHPSGLPSPSVTESHAPLSCHSPGGGLADSSCSAAKSSACLNDSRCSDSPACPTSVGHTACSAASDQAAAAAARPAAPPHGSDRLQRHLPQPVLGQMERLLAWLAASGEFAQETARLRSWHSHLARLPATAARSTLRAALDFAAWFEPAAVAALGRCTARVNRFRQEMAKQPRHRFREDAVLRDRRRSEYHQNLVGAELLNRAYRRDFERTERKAVLLPACLCARPGCAAQRPANRYLCAGCTPGCRVAQISAIGRSQGFETIVAPHESDAFSRQNVERLRRENTGIVGIACALQLIAGGWRAESLGLPAQCVILDYCGCRDHWGDRGGFPTDLNLARLKRILAPSTPDAT